MRPVFITNSPCENSNLILLARRNFFLISSSEFQRFQTTTPRAQTCPSQTLAAKSKLHHRTEPTALNPEWHACWSNQVIPNVANLSKNTSKDILDKYHEELGEDDLKEVSKSKLEQFIFDTSKETVWDFLKALQKPATQALGDPAAEFLETFLLGKLSVDIQDMLWTTRKSEESVEEIKTFIHSRFQCQERISQTTNHQPFNKMSSKRQSRQPQNIKQKKPLTDRHSTESVITMASDVTVNRNVVQKTRSRPKKGHRTIDCEQQND